MKRWTTREIRYLEEHANEGAKAIAEALNRSVESVKWQAGQYGISLRERWYCSRCGNWTFKPLNSKTGWCSACTKAARRHVLEEELREMEEEVMRERKEDKARNALYSRKFRLKSKGEDR